MSFEEDRRTNGSRAANLTVRYIDTRPRGRDLETEVRERERLERCRLEREERERQSRWVGNEISPRSQCMTMSVTYFLLPDTMKDKTEIEQETEIIVRTVS